MALRIKATWHESKRVHKGRRNRSREKTIEDRASVVAFNIWKVAQHVYRHMDEEKFKFTTENQIVGTLTEWIAFLLAVVDRMVYGQLSEEDRATLINTAAGHLARNMNENIADMAAGPGDYSGPFIDSLNRRLPEYAECSYENGEPGYAFKRLLGEKIGDTLAESDNKWVEEYVVDIEIPEALKMIKRLVSANLGIRAQ